MKKSEKEAKARLRNHEGLADADHVAIVKRKGTHIEYNRGQAVSQGFGSGVKDILAARRAAKQAKGGK